MAEYSPQYDLFKIINRLSKLGSIIFWLILIFSIFPFLFKEYCNTYNIINVMNVLNIISISLFFFIEILIDYILLPQADNKRRDDFIDNSFGSKFSTKNSIGYYDNDEVSNGLYKASVNLFQNCFFTYSLVKKITFSKITIPVIMLLLMMILAYYGIKEVPFALSVLQALFSANILGQLIKHIILLNRLSVILDNWILLFQNNDIKSNTYNYQFFIYRYWLQYETLHSKINAGITEKIFKKNNSTLTIEWENLKSKHNIK